MVCVSLLYLLYYDPTNINGLAIFWGLFWCEISNHPMYYVYHLQKAQPPVAIPSYLYLWECLQFSVCRTLCAVQFLWITPVTIPYLWKSTALFWMVSMNWAYGMWTKWISA
jgi:hypothetical protein